MSERGTQILQPSYTYLKQTYEYFKATALKQNPCRMNVSHISRCIPYVSNRLQFLLRTQGLPVVKSFEDPFRPL